MINKRHSRPKRDFCEEPNQPDTKHYQYSPVRGQLSKSWKRMVWVFLVLLNFPAGTVLRVLEEISVGLLLASVRTSVSSDLQD